MTEPTTAPVTDAPDEPATADVEASDDVELPQDLEAAKKLRSEAANLRRRNRELEDARASDLARLAAYEKAAVERAAAEVLVDPEDLWRYTDAETQQTFNDEFGAIVGTSVVEVAKKLVAERPHLARPNTAPPPSDRPLEGLRGGASPEPQQTEITWSSALRRSI